MCWLALALSRASLRGAQDWHTCGRQRWVQANHAGHVGMRQGLLDAIGALTRHMPIATIGIGLLSQSRSRGFGMEV